MAERARLSAPQPEAPKTRLPVQHTILPVSTFLKGERRLEAENYLVGGYGTRLQLEAQPGITRFGTLASAWQPSRLKGIQVGRTYGTPFLAATQVYDVRPVPRKFLALEQTDDLPSRQLQPGTIVVTRSGTVGRVTMAHEAHMGVIVSDDLLRVTPRDAKYRGWLFAYLRTSHANSMMTGAQYGHIIKHLETQHLEALPIPLPSDQLLMKFEEQACLLTEFRSRAHCLQLEAEAKYEEALGGPLEVPKSNDGFNISASEMLTGRRRFEASFHNPFVQALSERLQHLNLGAVPLKSVTHKVYWLSRFKRIFGEKGDPYFSADELFALNIEPVKRVLQEQAENPEQYRVKAGWLLMACSGQIYGLNGSCMMATKRHESALFSHDIIRIIANADLINSAYLLTALTHPTLGRPLIIRNAYGTSIPHLEPEDIANVRIPRLAQKEEQEIGDIAQQAVDLRTKADDLENEITSHAQMLTNDFLIGKKGNFQLPS